MGAFLFSHFAEQADRIGRVSGRYEKISLLAIVFPQLEDEDLRITPLAFSGSYFPAWDVRDLGVSSKLIVKAMSRAYSIPEERVMEAWREEGDLGCVAARYHQQGRQKGLLAGRLTLRHVFRVMRAFPAFEGQGSVERKILTISGLLARMDDPLSACYYVRLTLGDLRIGVGEGIIRDALIAAFILRETRVDSIPRDLSDRVQMVVDILNDLGEVAVLLKEHPEDFDRHATLQYFRPFKVMLAQRAASIQEAAGKVGVPFRVDYKYDGFRVVAHKKNGIVRLFTRRLEEVTRQFPEIVKSLQQQVKAEAAILDSEVIAYDPSTGRSLPFQRLSQRIKRKYDIHRLMDEIPVRMMVFDLLKHDDEDVWRKPYEERIRKLEQTLEEDDHIRFAAYRITEDVHEAEAFYQESLREGNEGVMVKSLKAAYQPGARVGTMLKVKPTLDTIDAVIVGGEYGEGKRAHWISSYDIAVRDGDRLVRIGRVGSGLKEKDEAGGVTFEEMTRLLEPLILSVKGREVTVKPHIVVEVAAEEIQKSDAYESGYALRFPRIIRVRTDRTVDDATTLDEIRVMYELQRGRHAGGTA